MAKEYLCVDNNEIKANFGSLKEAIEYRDAMDEATRGQENCRVFEINSIADCFRENKIYCCMEDGEFDSDKYNESNWLGCSAFGIKLFGADTGLYGDSTHLAFNHKVKLYKDFANLKDNLMKALNNCHIELTHNYEANIKDIRSQEDYSEEDIEDITIGYKKDSVNFINAALYISDNYQTPKEV